MYIVRSMTVYPCMIVECCSVSILVLSMFNMVLRVFILPLVELIITSGGENIPPVPIEDRIKSEIPFLSQAFLIGDQHNFLSCLLTLKVQEIYIG